MARSKRFLKTKARRSQAVSRRGQSQDLAEALAISAAASVNLPPPPLPACASKIFATYWTSMSIIIVAKIVLKFTI